MGLQGKVAIVSASGRGIGKAIALKLAEDGVKVVANSFHEETTQAVVDEIISHGGEAVGVPGDITSIPIINLSVEKSIETFGQIDILINNVGGDLTVPPDPEDYADEPLALIEAAWDGYYALNLKAPVLMVEAVTPHFQRQQSGKIVNISSVAGRPGINLTENPIHPHLAYGALKAGLIRYTQCLADKLGPFNINVNCVCPGIVYTDNWKGAAKNIVENFPQYKGQDPHEWFQGIFELKHMGDTFPIITSLRREQTIEDIANTTSFLVSEQAKNITGQSINVDGGMIKA